MRTAALLISLIAPAFALYPGQERNGQTNLVNSAMAGAQTSDEGAPLVGGSATPQDDYNDFGVNVVHNNDEVAQFGETCRSFSRFGICSSTPCGEGVETLSSGLIKTCDGEGEVCCHTDKISLEALRAAEADQNDIESPDDDYVPEWRNDIADLLKRTLPGSGSGNSPCWGNQTPFDCGMAYKSGKSLGRRQCIRWRGGKPVTVEVACAFKKLEDAANAAGHTIHLNSGFRTNAEQTRLWQNNCNSGRRRCRPATARPGYSNHQNGIALDIAVAAYPRLFQWLRDNATKFGFVRTVGSENWHWEYRPGFRCNSFVSYRCKSPPMLAEKCRGADNPSSPTHNLVCRSRSDCPGDNSFIPGQCTGNSFCCKPIPCNGHTDRFCVVPGEDVYGKDSGLCPGRLVCAKKQPKCRDHPEIGCVPQSEAKYGYFSGECPGSLYCPKPPSPCRSDASRTCEPRSECSLFGFDSGECSGSFYCCKTSAPTCEGDASRTCQSPGAADCLLYGNDSGLCPGSSTCCKKQVPCSKDTQFMCGDPTKMPEGVKPIRGQCPGSSVCFDTSGVTSNAQ